MRTPAVAVVGAGISGLAAARRLVQAGVRVTLFESGVQAGGHAHTVDVTLDGVRHGVDTGFLVFNRRTYPGLVSLFDALRVVTAPSDMSFSVQVRGGGHRHFEWSGSSLAALLAQPANAVRPRFWSMLAGILRFNRLCTRLAQRGEDAGLDMSLQEFLGRHRFGAAFREDYLLPMMGCIWSSPSGRMLDFPAGTLIRFCHNHGLLQVANRPQWYTVRGGSREYVQRLTEQLPDVRLRERVLRVHREGHGVHIATSAGSMAFDAAIIATHTDQALAMLGDASAAEQALLGAIRYQRNRAVLHTDVGVLPHNPRAWSAWNYERLHDARESRVCLHYLINRLQPLPWRRPVIVSLNPLRPLDPQQVLGEYSFDHPVFDRAAIGAQRNLAALQGRKNTWYCGAWTGYGFHEDGLQSGWNAAGQLLESLAPEVQAQTAWAAAA